ncbi:E3 ubiquitin-protein ligase rha1b [Phtheirospermum japonicum]|uniref:E3 ubiquitin-protein ligase rha1b n=1 Tax=Phtheirospermum japonicum TaxID=374723 RepID=A0A830BS16_9LAMI|nr:E3 ubiquitin-protein ligase rha1b [Phtheirospermum japonicum]
MDTPDNLRGMSVRVWRRGFRRLTNCRHIFHRSCLDRWMDHDQKTCPLCRTQFIPEEMQEAFNEKMWVASGNFRFLRATIRRVTTGW